jgi:hypothetical protein
MNKVEKMKLQELISRHNEICDSFDKEISKLMKDIQYICDPHDISAVRIDTYEKGKNVTRVHLMPKTSFGFDIDEEWLNSFYEEDDRM